MKPLYETCANDEHILKKIEEADDIYPEMDEDLKNLEGDFEKKCFTIGSFIKNLEVEFQAVGAHILKMEERHKKIERKISKVSESLKQDLINSGAKKLKGRFFDITLCDNPPKVELFDKTAIPANYIINKTETSIDVSSIARDLKMNKEVPGARLTQGKSLRIK